MIEIAAMLVLSTAHLTPATCNDYLPDERPTCFRKSDYGHFLYVGSDPDDTLDDDPDDLVEVLSYARAAGCLWIMFDQDGPITADLPTYDWNDA